MATKKEKAITDAARKIRNAWKNGKTIRPIRDSLPKGDLEAAYAVQQTNTDIWIKEGRRVIGRKIGLTAKAVQTQLGVDQPDYGIIYADMAVVDGDEIDFSTVSQPKAEAEVAFILARDLEGPGVTAADVLRATDCVMPCFEIVDSRNKDWTIKIQDTVADNASCGVLPLGGLRKSPRDIDLALAGMVLEKNGEIISTSCGASVQGSPVNAVAWLANTLGRLGIGLKAGDIILSGSQSPLVPVVAGDSLYCSVGGLGGTSVRFVA